MYCPAHFHEDRAHVLIDLIERHPFAAVIRLGEAGLIADHIPLMYDEAEGAAGKIIGHVASSNPLWQVQPGQEHLIIFQGPSAYISPNWYPTKMESGKAVPTWNYAVVHVYATLTASRDPLDIVSMLNKLTDHHEATQPDPWRLSDAPEDFIDRQTSRIVCIEFAIKHMHGKWKVSQNQPVQNRYGVINGLQGKGDDAASIASLVQQFGDRAGADS